MEMKQSNRFDCSVVGELNEIKRRRDKKKKSRTVLADGLVLRTTGVMMI
jgi:hypothetical protein